jgi:hypothetical protein
VESEAILLVRALLAYPDRNHAYYESTDIREHMCSIGQDCKGARNYSAYDFNNHEYKADYDHGFEFRVGFISVLEFFKELFIVFEDANLGRMVVSMFFVVVAVAALLVGVRMVFVLVRMAVTAVLCGRHVFVLVVEDPSGS